MSDILKEYLVGLGFKIDQDSYKKFNESVKKTGKNVAGLATIVSAMAVTGAVFVEKFSAKLGDLYWASVRLRDGAANIQDFKLSISKMGGSSDAAAASMENLTQYLQTNPASEPFLHHFGVATRNINGELRSSADIIKDIAKLPQPQWLKAKIAATAGIDYQTLMATIRGESSRTEKVATKMWQSFGLSADEAAKKAKDFNNDLQDTETRWQIVAMVVATRFLPVAERVLDWADAIAVYLGKLDKATQGWSSTILGLLADFTVAAGAARLLFGLNFVTMLGKAVWWVTTLGLRIAAVFGQLALRAVGGLLLRLAVLTATAFPAVSEAILAVGAAIEATPIGWIITGIALLAAGAYLVYRNWDSVKALFKDLFGWVAKTFNIVAKWLHLPQFDFPAPHEDAPQPDFRDREKGVGAWSHYGAPGAPGAPAGANDGQDAPGHRVIDGYGDTRAAGPSGGAVGKALAFFQKAGWSAAQAAGIVANLVRESALDARAVGDKGQAYGIGQWHPDRQADFKRWSGGTDIHDSTTDQQLAFLQFEMTKGALATKKFAEAMKAGATNAYLAGSAVSKYVERPKDDTGREADYRGNQAVRLMNGAKLAPGGASQGRGPVTVNQKTEIKVSSNGDPAATGRAVGREQSRVNGDIARNFAGSTR